jgi:hypothetical protein
MCGNGILFLGLLTTLLGEVLAYVVSYIYEVGCLYRLENSGCHVELECQLPCADTCEPGV